MPKLGTQLELPRCPHCRVDTPSLHTKSTIKTTAHDAGNSRTWKTYECSRCGGITTAWALADGGDIQQMFPASTELDTSIDKRARNYLNQAMDTVHAPAGSVMLSASAVDAMLKAKARRNRSMGAAASRVTATPVSVTSYVDNKQAEQGASSGGATPVIGATASWESFRPSG